MLHDREDVENILFREGRLVPVVKVVLLQQYLQEPKRLEVTVTTYTGTWQEKRGETSLEFCRRIHSQNISCITTWGQSFERSCIGVHHHMRVAKPHCSAKARPCQYWSPDRGTPSSPTPAPHRGVRRQCCGEGKPLFFKHGQP